MKIFAPKTWKDPPKRLKTPFFKHYNNFCIQLPSKISKLILCHQMISTVGPKFLSLRLFLLCVTPERKSTRRPLRPPQFGAAWQKHHISRANLWVTASKTEVNWSSNSTQIFEDWRGEWRHKKVLSTDW